MAVEVAKVRRIRRKYVTTVIISIVVYFIASFLHTLASFEFGVDAGIFPRTLLDVTREYPVRISHVNWSEITLWIISYSTQGIWLIYSVILIWRKSHNKESNYKNPAICTSVYVYNLLTLVFTIFWLMTYCYKLLWVSFIFGVLMQIHIGVGLGCSLKAVRNCKERNAMHDSKREVFLAMILVHNPLGLTCAAISYIVIEGLVQTLVYNLGASQTVASSVGYIVLILEMAAYYVADIYFIWQHTVYLITPYITLVWLFIGALVAQEEVDSWEFEFSAFMLAVAVVALMVKLAVTLYRVWYLGFKYDDSCAWDGKPRREKTAKRENFTVIAAAPSKGILKSNKQTIHEVQPAILSDHITTSNLSIDSWGKEGMATVYHVPPPRAGPLAMIPQATVIPHTTLIEAPPQPSIDPIPLLSLPVSLSPPAPVVSLPPPHPVVEEPTEPAAPPLAVGSLYHVPAGKTSHLYPELGPGGVAGGQITTQAVITPGQLAGPPPYMSFPQPSHETGEPGAYMSQVNL